MTTIQKTLITATIVVAGLATSLMIQHQVQVRLLEKNQSLRQQNAQLQADSEGLSNRVASGKPFPFPEQRTVGHLYSAR